MQWDRDCCKKAWGSSGPHFEGFHFFTVHRTLAFRSCEPLVKSWDHKELPTLREHFEPTTKIHRMLRLQLRNTKTVKKQQRNTEKILLAISSTKSQQLSLGKWCVLGPSFVLGVPTQCQRLQFYRGSWCQRFYRDFMLKTSWHWNLEQKDGQCLQVYHYEIAHSNTFT